MKLSILEFAFTLFASLVTAHDEPASQNATTPILLPTSTSTVPALNRRSSSTVLPPFVLQYDANLKPLGCRLISVDNIPKPTSSSSQATLPPSTLDHSSITIRVTQIPTPTHYRVSSGKLSDTIWKRNLNRAILGLATSASASAAASVPMLQTSILAAPSLPGMPASLFAAFPTLSTATLASVSIPPNVLTIIPIISPSSVQSLVTFTMPVPKLGETDYAPSLNITPKNQLTSTSSSRASMTTAVSVRSSVTKTSQTASSSTTASNAKTGQGTRKVGASMGALVVGVVGAVVLGW